MSSRSTRARHFLFALSGAMLLAACGGGGGGSSNTTPPPPARTLNSINLSPAVVALAPGKSTQLTVIGTYSDGSTSSLTASGEQFTSSDTAVASISTAGVVTVSASAAVGATATIAATDTASNVSTGSAGSTLVTAISSTSIGLPNVNSPAAVTATAQNNSTCKVIAPFYWEIGDLSGALASASVPDSTGATVERTTRLAIASASKWIYGTYIVQLRKGVNNLMPADVDFLHFTSGYSNMGVDTTGATCTPPPGNAADSVKYCLTLSGSKGPFNAQDPTTTGVFAYDGGHLENHAGQFQPEINALDTSAIGPVIVNELLGSGSTANFNYTQPLLAGGIFTSAADYAQVLQGIVSGQLLMHDALGTSPVCAWTSSSGSCNAAFSPVGSTQWHYSIAHWVESPAGDGAFSSPGAFGFYPWIEASKNYYGVISRAAPTGQGLQEGVASGHCATLLRKAWDTGTAQ